MEHKVMAEDDKSDVIKNRPPKIDSYMVPVVFDKAARSHSHKQQAGEGNEGIGRGLKTPGVVGNGG